MYLTKDALQFANDLQLQFLSIDLATHYHTQMIEFLTPTCHHPAWRQPLCFHSFVETFPDDGLILLNSRIVRLVWHRQIRLAVEPLNLGPDYGRWAARYLTSIVSDLTHAGARVWEHRDDPCTILIRGPATEGYIKLRFMFNVPNTST